MIFGIEPGPQNGFRGSEPFSLPVQNRVRCLAELPGQFLLQPKFVFQQVIRHRYYASRKNGHYAREFFPAKNAIHPLTHVIRVRPLSQIIQVSKLTTTLANPVAEVTVRPVVGGNPQAVMTLDEFRREWPLLRTSFLLAEELYDATNPGTAAELGIGPTFDELLEVSNAYIQTRVTCPANGDRRDIEIYNWRLQARDVLENAIRGGVSSGTEAVPILAAPEWLDSSAMKRFQWTGILADGKKCHTGKVPCHTDLEKNFADFLDSAKDVVRYLKNERFGFSVTYYEHNRPRQFYPDFIVVVRHKDGTETMWLAETKGEMRVNVPLKNDAAKLWCEKMSATQYGQWKYLFAQQVKLEQALRKGAATWAELASLMR